MKTISISIVIYQSKFPLLKKTFQCLADSLQHCYARRLAAKASLTLVNNDLDPEYHRQLQDLARQSFSGTATDLFFKHRHGNIGYGRGHNLALCSSGCDFHLVLNPDVFLEKETLSKALVFMKEHPEIGLLAPRCLHENGNPQLLIKTYPSVSTLVLRGISPYFSTNPLFKRLFDQRLGAYCGTGKNWMAPRRLHNELVSGCFMFFRQAPLRKTRGFSQDFFLYFEDYDLSMRMYAFSGIAYDPGVVITHLGGNTSRKGWLHILYFIRSAIRFFSRHGWRFF